MEWLQEHLQLLKEGLADLVLLCRLALPCAMQGHGKAPSCTCPAVYRGEHWVQSFAPPSTCSAVSRIATSEGPNKVCTEGCSGAVSTISRWDPQEYLQCSFLCMGATLWSRCSNMNRPHSCFWVVVQPECSLCISSRNNWPWRIQSATLLKYPVLWA